MGYLDEISIGGKISTVIDDFDQLQAMPTDLGLQLNKQKCEAIVTKNLPPSAFLALAASTRLLQTTLLPSDFQVSDLDVSRALTF